MAHPRRWIRSRKLYEVSFHTKEGLPLVPTAYMTAIVKSVMARAQFLYPVEINKYLWMLNHPHMLLRPYDAQDFVRFLGYTMKEINESTKRLLGIKRQSLWIRRPFIAEIGNIEYAKKRIAYLYNNPTKAGLENSIDRYPGLNTWEHEIWEDETWQNESQTIQTLDHNVIEKVPYVTRTKIHRLPCNSMNRHQDRCFTEAMIERTEEEHELIIKPNGWIEPFLPDASSEDIQEASDDVLHRVRRNEEEFKKERLSKGYKVLGAQRLMRQSIKKTYPSDHLTSHHLCYMTDRNEDRLEWVQLFKEFCRACHAAYEAWKIGNYRVEWPPGSFRPAMPPTASHYVFE